VILLCIATLLSLLSCKIKDRFLVDGPGMENTHTWDSFNISRSDSFAQYNFYIAVQYDAGGYIVTGELRDDDGTEYAEETGIVLPKKACAKIDQLYPGELPDAVPRPPAGDDEPFVLDAPMVDIVVTYPNGEIQQKVDDNDFSIQVYEIVLPYFREKFN
jgi:hypothetical protein